MGLQKSKNDDQKEEKIVTNYKCTLKWKQRIGKSVAFYKKTQKISDIRQDFENAPNKIEE